MLAGVRNGLLNFLKGRVQFELLPAQLHDPDGIPLVEGPGIDRMRLVQAEIEQDACTNVDEDRD